VFLVLQGLAEFEIDGEAQVLGPGQMCVALVDETHTVRNVGNEPVIMYLSETPHIQPTHTRWSVEGEKEPPQFNPSSSYDVSSNQRGSVEALAERHLSAVETLAEAADAAREVQREQMKAFTRALAGGEKQTALEARDTMWDALYPLFCQLFQAAGAWNDLACRTAEGDFMAAG